MGEIRKDPIMGSAKDQLNVVCNIPHVLTVSNGSGRSVSTRPANIFWTSALFIDPPLVLITRPFY